MLSSNRLIFTATAVFFFCFFSCTDEPHEIYRMPMEEQYENSLKHTWLSKEVYESTIIDDMESPSDWSTTGICTISYTTDRAKDGSQSLRFRTSMRDEENIKANINEIGSFVGGQGGHTSATLRFTEPQDWSAYNRISLWVYVHPTSMRTYSFHLGFECENAPETITSPYLQSFIQDLKPGEWNHVVWEIPNLKRDRVTEFEINQILRGHDPEDEGIVTYDFDNIELQRVDAEKYEGWEVAPGKIAFNHVGYTPEQSKTAYASGISSPDFQLIDADTREVILSKPLRTITNDNGTFQILDFSEVRKPGTYLLRSGNTESRSFSIAHDLWKRPLVKAINFYFCERCGYDVPGVHSVCHQDWQGIHNGVRKVINGGWHDAGDLSQGSFRTGMSVYAMMEIVRQLSMRNSDPELEKLVFEEALWGLDWLLKTRFGDGYRMTWSMMRIYTDGEIGTIDDVITPARNIPWENFLASAVEAFSCEVLKDRLPDLADECLKAAREDWNAAYNSQPDWSNGSYREASWGVLSSIHLYRATGEQVYADRAIEFGHLLLQCQQQRFADRIPITGYFYTDSNRESIIHNEHTAFEESPLLAMTALCTTFPDHNEWIDWYGAASLHSEYFLKRGAQIASPYDLIPNSVWRKSEILRRNNPEQRADMLRQFNEGTLLNDEYSLRTFPIWTRRLFHGNTAIHLSGTLALAAAVQLRNDLEGEALVRKQLQWVFGGNPFSQSLMYGEGYDYAPQFAYCLKDLVGALPVGMDSMHNDEPYWSGSNYATYKEIWIVPVSRFLWNMAYQGMPAFIEGTVADSGVETIFFHDQRTEYETSAPVTADGSFQTSLPAGDYVIEYGSAQRTLNMVSGGNYDVTLNPQQTIDFTADVNNRNIQNNTIQIGISAEGTGTHDLAVRVFNGTAGEPVKTVNFDSGATAIVQWDIRITDPEKPWTAVIVPDGELTWKQELTGTMEENE